MKGREEPGRGEESAPGRGGEWVNAGEAERGKGREGGSVMEREEEGGKIGRAHV